MVAKAFFTMERRQQIAALANYHEQYGQGAYSYAVGSLSEWSNGLKSPSGQTLRRILEAVLPAMPFSVKKDVIVAIRGVVLPVTSASVSLHMSGWKEAVEQEIANHAAKRSSVQYPEELTQAASWLTSDECDQIEAVMAAIDSEETKLIRSVWDRDRALVASAVLEMDRMVEEGRNASFNHDLESPHLKINMSYSKHGRKKSFFESLSRLFT